MAIILAIEPDRRQRDTLTVVVRQRVGAELILADTTEHALEAIGSRVPDLVLVPALLSPTDDAALAAALRVIAAAAHVRTLTIPVLAAQSASEAKTGLFSRWRRGNTAPAPDGCDPALFAEQIVAYLKESAAERALLAEQEQADRRRAVREQPQGTAAAVAPAEAALDVPPDMQAFTKIDEPDYAQPEMPAAAYIPTEMPAVQAETETPSAYAGIEASTSLDDDALSPAGERTYTRADTEIYRPADTPVPIYTPAYSFRDTQSEITHAGSQPDEQVVALERDAVVSESASLPDEESRHDGDWYALQDVPPYAQHDFSARLYDELVAHVNGGNYDAPPGDGNNLATVEREQEVDIDLSGELAELEKEDAAGTGADELFDGEPIGIYTMPSLTDEPGFEMPRFTFGRSRVEPTATPEPRFEAQADPEFVIEEPIESDLGVNVDVDVEVEVEAAALEPAAPSATEAVAAFAVEDETVATLAEERAVTDVEPEPADAEPWVSSGLTARWGWPIIQGFPSDSLAPGFARADSLAAAADPVSAPKPPPPAPRLVPPPQIVPRAAPAPIPSITVPRPAPVLPTLTVPRAAVAAAAPRANGTGAKSGRPEWSELVASLRKDIERRRVEPPQEKPKARPAAVESVPPAPAPASVPVSAAVPVPAPVMRRSRRSKPIQDEWGFFDPEQCGFAALLAKLDEITEDADEKDVRLRT